MFLVQGTLLQLLLAYLGSSLHTEITWSLSLEAALRTFMQRMSSLVSFAFIERKKNPYPYNLIVLSNGLVS